MPLAVAAVALTAGLAVATFVKAFGVGFLARPRCEAAAAHARRRRSMLAGMGVAGAACVVLALAPALVAAGVARGSTRCRPAQAVAFTDSAPWCGCRGSPARSRRADRRGPVVAGAGGGRAGALACARGARTGRRCRCGTAAATA